MMMRRTLEPFHKGNVGNTSERWGGAHMGFFRAHRYNVELNCTDDDDINDNDGYNCIFLSRKIIK